MSLTNPTDIKQSQNQIKALETTIKNRKKTTKNNLKTIANTKEIKPIIVAQAAADLAKADADEPPPRPPKTVIEQSTSIKPLTEGAAPRPALPPKLLGAPLPPIPVEAPGPRSRGPLPPIPVEAPGPGSRGPLPPIPVEAPASARPTEPKPVVPPARPPKPVVPPARPPKPVVPPGHRNAPPPPKPPLPPLIKVLNSAQGAVRGPPAQKPITSSNA